MLQYGKFTTPQGTTESVPAEFLTRTIVEDIKTRFIFVSPVMVSAASIGVAEKTPIEDMESKYASVSTAVDVHYPITLSTNSRDRTIGTLIIPGWVRERAAEVLFEGDEDEASIVGCLLECLLKVKPNVKMFNNALL